MCAAASVVAAETNSPAASPTPDTNAPPAAAPAEPADTNAPAKTASAPEPLTPEQLFEGGATNYPNWIEWTVGDTFISGNKAQYRSQRQSSGGVFGGIEDFHYKADVSKGTALTIDGRSILDDRDYNLTLDLRREKVGYLRFHASEFRTWSNGDGGFDSSSGLYYSKPGDELALDRGEVSFEGGLRLDKYPNITFKYTHAFRDGEKDSTHWGMAHPNGASPAKGLASSFYDIDEHSDTFQLDISKKIGKTDVSGGLRYEFGNINNALKADTYPGEPTAQRITDRQETSYDLFSTHAATETWLKKNLMLSTGCMYSTLESDLSGSRIYGSDYDVGYVPGALSGTGYTRLSGDARTHECVADLNLFYQPKPHFTIVPSVRILNEVSDSSSTGLGTMGAYSPNAFAAGNDSGSVDVRERLDLRYNGLTNWVLWARGDLTEGEGNVHQTGGLTRVNGIGLAPVSERTDQDRFFQKYSLGARWYPLRKVSLDAGAYWKRNQYDYNNRSDSTANDASSFDRYPAYLASQNFDTFDNNYRITWRPLPTLALISRYEFQYSTIHTRPNPASGLAESESATMTTHIIAQDVSWTPWSRLFLQAGLNHVLSTTRTPASDMDEVNNASVVNALLKAQNNYWTVHFDSSFVVDAKTDLNLGYFYYLADDYANNSAYGVPYGSGAEEHGVTAALIRRISSNLRLKLRYGFSHYTDATFGGHRDYDAHVIMSTLQYRF